MYIHNMQANFVFVVYIFRYFSTYLKNEEIMLSSLKASKQYSPHSVFSLEF